MMIDDNEKEIEAMRLFREGESKLAHCFQPMVNRRIKLLSALTEHSMK